MRRTVPALLLVVAAMLGAPASAFAKGLPGSYAALRLGGFFPQSGDLTHAGGGSFGAGFDGELALGTYLAPGAILEGTVGAFRTSRTSGGGSEAFRVVPVTLGIKGQLFLDRIEPFAGLGIGVYSVRDEMKGGGSAASDTDVRVGLHAGAGANFNLPDNLFLGVEGRYLWLKADTFGRNVRLDGVTLTAALGYRF